MVENITLTKVHYNILIEGKVIWCRMFFVLTTVCQWKLFTLVTNNVFVLEAIIAEYWNSN